jgi:hypothetical protein
MIRDLNAFNKPSIFSVDAHERRYGNHGVQLGAAHALEAFEACSWLDEGKVDSEERFALSLHRRDAGARGFARGWIGELHPAVEYHRPDVFIRIRSIDLMNGSKADLMDQIIVKRRDLTWSRGNPFEGVTSGHISYAFECRQIGDPRKSKV